MKNTLTTFLFVALFGVANAQQNDSLTVINSKWSKQKIAPKTALFLHHFKDKNLFSANQYISYIEIKRKGNAPLFQFANEIKVKKTTSKFGKENGALAAINGTFFDVANGGSVDFIKINGKVEKENVIGKNGIRARHQQSAVVIDEKGKLSLRKWDQTPNWEKNLPEPNIMLSGPLLINDKIYEVLDTTSFTKARHPRTAVGVKANGNVILLTVDGRHENSAGMSLHELGKLMRWLGCVSAINLDGGGSTTLWTQKDGVINFPSDNKKWDHEGERTVANVIILKQK